MDPLCFPTNMGSYRSSTELQSCVLYCILLSWNCLLCHFHKNFLSCHMVHYFNLICSLSKAKQKIRDMEQWSFYNSFSTFLSSVATPPVTNPQPVWKKENKLFLSNQIRFYTARLRLKLFFHAFRQTERSIYLYCKSLWTRFLSVFLRCQQIHTYAHTNTHTFLSRSAVCA